VVAGGEEVEVDGEATPLIPVPWEECIFPPGYDIEELFRIIKEEDLKKEREKEKEKEKGKEKERRNEKEKEKEKEQEKEKEKEKQRGKEETETKEGQSFNTRRYYGEVDPYVTNAQFFGNVGRFINVRTWPLPSISLTTPPTPTTHTTTTTPPTTTTTYYFFKHSCDPNLLKQQVFMEHHDVRFPQLSFFTARWIAPMTELTWNYGYSLDSVPGKSLPCSCGASNCSGRLY